MSGLSSSCQRAQPQWETCELDQGEVGHELVGVEDGEQVRVGDGHGWTWCNALDRWSAQPCSREAVPALFFLRVVSNNVIKVRRGSEGER